MNGLTKAQRATIERIANLSGNVILYRDSSMSGKSETLRYRRQWAEQGRWGMTPRTRTGMILSVKINVLDDGSDDPVSLERYESKCKAAEKLFNELRTS